MARRAGRRPPPTPPPPGTPGISPVASAFERVAVPRGFIDCRLCHNRVRAIPAHLQLDHPQISVAQYTAEYPRAPLAAEGRPEDPPEEPTLRRAATKKQAERHPGGRFGAEVELSIEDSIEKRQYRLLTEELVDAGHEPSYQLADLAYYQLLARRMRHKIEEIHRLSGNDEVLGGEFFEMLERVSKRITQLTAEVEKARKEKAPEANPLSVLEAELAAAEEWVQSQIGEHVSECPGCGQMLTTPALPHFAFEPFELNGKKTWHVWSSELWRLFRLGRLRLADVAYTLRTSPEGLKRTAAARGETWPDSIVLEAEEQELRRLLDADDREYTRAAVAAESRPERPVTTVSSTPPALPTNGDGGAPRDTASGDPV